MIRIDLLKICREDFSFSLALAINPIDLIAPRRLSKYTCNPVPETGFLAICALTPLILSHPLPTG